jgi:hypothetical protein
MAAELPFGGSPSMMRILKLLAVIALLCVPISLPAQTIRANSCNAADVQNAWSTVTAATTTFIIPAGTCTWTNTSPVVLQAPTGSTSITIQGSGSTTGSDTLGNPTGYNDQTTIIFHTTNISPLQFSGSAAQTLYRITGLTFEQDSGSTGYTNGLLSFGGRTDGVPFLRVDHSHFWANGQNGSTVLGITYGFALGVFDHNVFTETFNGVDNGIRVGAWSAYGDSSGLGNGSWSNATAFGSNQFLFFENNAFINSYANDCTAGGRQVFRHNTYTSATMQAHEMANDARGCRATEVYENLFNGNFNAPNDAAESVEFRMGTGLFWGNTINSYTTFVNLDNDRTNGHPFGATPNGWGYCGTLGSTAGPSGWDGNNDSTGWPCIDQVGRGKSDALTGLFPTKCNSSMGCSTYNGSWPHNLLEPVYEWMDTTSVVTYKIGNGSPGGDFVQNRDWYQENTNQSAQTSPTSPFNGSTGTGHGTLANRPTACTAGPGGTYGVSPTGSFGVGYWATDTNTLYVCTATNTWTSYYTPYTYPHPLEQGGTSTPTSTVINPPTGLTATVN